jgi:hypothetical protein
MIRYLSLGGAAKPDSLILDRYLAVACGRITNLAHAQFGLGLVNPTGSGLTTVSSPLHHS